MIRNVLQCCYTNASREVGDIVTSGWQAVCVSPDLPHEAFLTCTKIQNANSSIQSTMIDENGNILNLLEISGDGSFIYVIRTQYGMLDRLGRANMFSHAFIFPCKDSEIISNPNSFLTIANDNFKDNEEAAMEYSEELSRLPPFDIADAMKTCNIDQEKYLILIKSVYAQMSDKKTTKSLYIQYDGTEESLRTLLFCIYYALPYSLRRRLSIASVQTENTVGKDIIFSRKAKEQELYIDPASGDNTILTARIERRLLRLGFLDFVMKNISHPEIQHYFELLEGKAIELGDLSGSNELMLKIAHIQLTNQDLCIVEDIELEVRISDALRSNSIGNSVMDAYIALLLSEISLRKLVLTDENEIALLERLEESVSDSLLRAVEQYDFYRFNELPTSDAANKLSKMSKEVFKNYRAKLTSLNSGRKILDYYYAEIILRQLENSWDGIQKVLDATLDLTIKPLTDDKIDEYAWKLYYSSLDKIKDGDINHVLSEYKHYMKIMQQSLVSQRLSECGRIAREAFWDQISYNEIYFDMIHLYRYMEVQTPKCQRLLTYGSLPSVFTQEGEIAFFRTANVFFIDAENDLENQFKSAVERVIAEVEKSSVDLNQHFERWCKALFVIHDSRVFEDLIELFRCTEESGINEILDAFKRFITSSSRAEISSNFKKEIAKIVNLICVEKDSEKQPVALDGWLLLGENLYTNSFYIFNVIRPFILDVDAVDVIADSDLIRKHKYCGDAEKYVQGRGNEYRTVKKWLSTLRRLRRIEANARKETDESKQGLIGRGISALSKLTQGKKRHNRSSFKPNKADNTEGISSDKSIYRKSRKQKKNKKL